VAAYNVEAGSEISQTSLKSQHKLSSGYVGLLTPVTRPITYCPQVPHGAAGMQPSCMQLMEVTQGSSFGAAAWLPRVAGFKAPSDRNSHIVPSTCKSESCHSWLPTLAVHSQLVILVRCGQAAAVHAGLTLSW
jgi:hypothetical protein